MTREQETKIEKRVYEKYPVKKKEYTCQSEKVAMENLRNIFRKRLIEDQKEKREL